MDALRKIAALVRDPNVTADPAGFGFALLVSLLVALALSYLYRLFYEDRATGSQIHRSFVLLGPSITAIFIAIQFSLPLSLGLLGALSIIRFRTPIKEPEEVAFIMLLCASSVVAATYQFVLLILLLVLVTVGLVIKRFLPGVMGSSRKDGLLLVSLQPGADGSADVQQRIVRALPRAKLESVSEIEGVTSLQYSFCDLTTEVLDRLRADLRAVPGLSGIQVYFNRATGIL